MNQDQVNGRAETIKGNVKEAARILGISRATVYRKLGRAS